MKITDEKCRKFLSQARSFELNESVRTFPEDERDGKSDLEILSAEVDYLLEICQADGTTHGEILAESRRILRETKNGKEIPIILPYCKPQYSNRDIQDAKDAVNEYNRLKRLQAKLHGG